MYKIYGRDIWRAYKKKVSIKVKCYEKEVTILVSDLLKPMKGEGQLIPMDDRFGTEDPGCPSE